MLKRPDSAPPDEPAAHPVENLDGPVTAGAVDACVAEIERQVAALEAGGVSPGAWEDVTRWIRGEILDE